MKIDRYMVNLFFEIRRNVPLALQEGMAISNPRLGDDMIALYRNTDDENIKLLITVFLQRAGEEWYSKIMKKKRRYRGTEMSDRQSSDRDQRRQSSVPQGNIKPKRIYRGQVVD